MLTVVDGVEQLQTFFGQYLPQLAIAAAAPFAIFAVIAFWDVPTALVLLAAALFALAGPMAVHMLDRRASLAHPLAERVRRGLPGRHAGPAHAQVLWPGQGLGERAERASSRTTLWCCR